MRRILCLAFGLGALTAAAGPAWGQAALDYEIVIDPSGKVLVNGADVQALVPKDL